MRTTGIRTSAARRPTARKARRTRGTLIAPSPLLGPARRGVHDASASTTSCIFRLGGAGTAPFPRAPLLRDERPPPLPALFPPAPRRLPGRVRLDPRLDGALSRDARH